MKARALVVLLLGLTTCSCSSAQLDIGYPYYVVHPEVDKLEAHDPSGKDDLKLSESCAPDAKVKAKCIGMLEAKFYELVKELLKLRKAKSDLERGPQP